MSAPLSIVLTYIGIIVLFFVVIYVGGRFICRIYDYATETPEERMQREAEEIARKATQEFEKRRRMRSGFWNVFN